MRRILHKLAASLFWVCLVVFFWVGFFESLSDSSLFPTAEQGIAFFLVLVILWFVVTIIWCFTFEDD